MPNKKKKIDLLGVSEPPAGKPQNMVVADPRHLMSVAYARNDPDMPLVELVQNSLDAKASEIYVGVDWVSAITDNVFRLMVADNGCGMSDSELVGLSRFGHSVHQKTLGPDNNFGIGGRGAILPLSPKGMFFISCKDHIWHMLRLFLDEESGQFRVYPFLSVDGPSLTAAPPDEYIEMASKELGIITEGHGTMVILIGKNEDHNTFFELGGPKEGNHGHLVALNTKYARVPQNTTIYVENNYKELKDLKSSRRHMKGALHYISNLSESQGTIRIDTFYLGAKWSADIHWFVLCPEGGKPSWANRHEKNKPSWGKGMSAKTINASPHGLIGGGVRGLTACIHKDRLYDLSTHARRLSPYELFIPGTSLHKHVAILVEPLENTGVGNPPNRSTLVFRNSSPPPLTEWAQAFAEQLPKELQDMRNSFLGTISTEDATRDLLREFLTDFVALMGKDILRELPSGGGTVRGKSKDTKGGGDGPRKTGDGKKRTAVDHVPDHQWRVFAEEEYKDRAAIYQPASNLLILNAGFPGLKWDVERAKGRLAGKFPTDVVEEAVRDTYYLALASRVAQAIQYKKSPSFNPADFERMISNEALTLAVLGGLGTESMLSRVLKLPAYAGRKRRKTG